MLFGSGVCAADVSGSRAQEDLTACAVHFSSAGTGGFRLNRSLGYISFFDRLRYNLVINPALFLEARSVLLIGDTTVAFRHG
jgi:hypothetical protein